MTNDGIMQTDKTIKYDPAKSILQCKIGEGIMVTAEGFEKLSSAFLADIERKNV
jgi:hypothetical protein